jgi:hypothetical protein
MSRTQRALCLAVACAAVAGTAFADETWDASFAPQQLAVIQAPLDTVMVLPSGTDAERVPAGQALTHALTATGKTHIVPPATEGDVPGANNLSMVAQAQTAPPATTFAIVRIERIFPGDARGSVVVAFYDKAGRWLGSASARKGGTLVWKTPPPESAAAGGLPPELVASAGTVPVTFSSNGTPIRISTIRNAPLAARLGLSLPPLWAPVCTTPCTLYLPPGKFSFQTPAFGQDTIVVPAAGANVRLRDQTQTATRVGAGLLLGGIPVTLGGVVGLSIWGATSNVHRDWGNHKALGAGAGLLGVGQLMMAIGIPLIYTHASAVAKVTVGPGNLSGKF